MSDIEQRYQKLKKIQEELLKVKQKIERYEQDPLIKDYIYQKKLIDLYDTVINKDIVDMALNTEDTDIIESVIIYTYYGTYLNASEGKDHQVMYDYFRPDFRKYKNIETGDVIKIKISNDQEFNKENIILYPDNINTDLEQFYNESREKFFDKALTQGISLTKKQYHRKNTK